MRDWSHYNLNVAAAILSGSLILVLGVLWLGGRLVFIARAEQLYAPIVSVSFEYVPQGKGSTLAYVPTVELQRNSQGPVEVKVETFSKQPIYSVGEQLAVLCDVDRSSPNCVEASVIDYLIYPILAVLIGTGLLLGGLCMRRNDGEEAAAVGVDLGT